MMPTSLFGYLDYANNCHAPWSFVYSQLITLFQLRDLKPQELGQQLRSLIAISQLSLQLTFKSLTYAWAKNFLGAGGVITTE